MTLNNGFFWDIQLFLLRVFDFPPTGNIPTNLEIGITGYLLDLIPYVITMVICLLPFVVIYRLIRVFFGG